MRDPEELIGRVLGGKYRLDALLGQGGFGAVFRGWHQILDVPLAVKVSLRLGGVLGERFRREAQTLMRLSHPGIVRIYDYDAEPDGLTYLVQEFVDGRTLRDVLTDRGPLPPALAVEIGAQVLDALDNAHRHGVVHRDVKLDNIMLTERGGRPVARLLDFGIAKPVEASDSEPELTHTGGALGTPAYMAPEQIRGDPRPASDLYAMGVLLFLVLTGRKPFPQPPPEVYIAHIQAPIPPLPPSVPPAIAEVVRQALAKHYDDRAPSAAAMRAALLAAGGAASGGPRPVVSASAAPRAPGPGEIEVEVGHTPTSTEMRGALPTLHDEQVAPSRRRWLALPAGLVLALGAGLLWFGIDGPVDSPPARPVAAAATAADPPATALADSPDALVLPAIDPEASVDAGPARPEAGTPDRGAAHHDAAAERPDASSDPVAHAAKPQPSRRKRRPPTERKPSTAERKPSPPAPIAERRKPTNAATIATPPAAPPPSPLDRLRIEMAACRCQRAGAILDDITTDTEPARLGALRHTYRKRCQMPGIPGSCL